RLRKSTRRHKMESKPIYQDSNFTITKELFIAGNARFAIAHLCSVRLVKSTRQIPYTMLVLELLLIVAGAIFDFRFNGYVVLLGVLGLLANAALYILVKPVHKLTLSFISGEKEVIGITDYAYLDNLANMFGKSMVETRQQRGMMIS